METRRLHPEDRSHSFRVSILGDDSLPLVCCALASSGREYVYSAHEDCCVYKWNSSTGEVCCKYQYHQPASSISCGESGEVIIGFFDGNIHQLGRDSPLASFPGSQLYQVSCFGGNVVALLASARDRMPIPRAHSRGMSDRLQRMIELDAHNLPYRLSNGVSRQFYLEGAQCCTFNLKQAQTEGPLESPEMTYFSQDEEEAILCFELMKPTDEGSFGKSMLAFGSVEGCVVLHCSESTEPVASILPHKEAILCMASCGQQLLFTGSTDRTIQRTHLEFSTDSNMHPVLSSSTELGALVGHMSDITCLHYVSSTNMLFSGSADMQVRLWDLDSGSTTIRFEAHHCSVPNITVCDGWLVTSSSDASICSWTVPCSCLRCGEQNLTLSLLSQHELHTCPARQVLCPQGCGLMLLAKDAPDHVRTQCPERLVQWQCKWKCGAKGVRGYQQLHHEDDTTSDYWNALHKDDYRPQHIPHYPTTHMKLCKPCPNRPIKCRHGCGQLLMASLQHKHESNCPERRVQCPHLALLRANSSQPEECPEGCFEQIKFCELAIHEGKCPVRRVACSNGCGGEFELRHLQIHCERHCPLRATRCCNRGCDKQVVAASLDEHQNKECIWRPILCECGDLYPFCAIAKHKASKCPMRMTQVGPG